MNIKGFENLICIYDFELTKSVNKHCICMFSGAVADADIDYFINCKGKETLISDDENDWLYGIVTEVIFQKDISGGTVYVTVRAYSYFLDEKRRTRIFQNPSKTLGSLILSADLRDMEIKTDNALCGEKIEYPVVQDNETDFELIKRLTEEYGLYLWIDDIDNRICIEKVLSDSKAKKITYGDLSKYKVISSEKEMTYLLSSQKMCCTDFGRVIELDDIGMLITGYIVRKEKEIFEIEYTGAVYDDFKYKKTDEYFPEHIRKFKAVVCSNDDPENLGRIQVEFITDSLYPLENENSDMSKLWIPYLTSYTGTSCGYKFIPEKGDTVDVEFSGKRMTAYGSYRTDKMAPEFMNADKKHISLDKDTYIEFSENDILLFSHGSKISLSEDKCEIKVGSNILVVDKNNIRLCAGNSEMIADDNKLRVLSGGSEIDVQKDITICSGSKLKLCAASDVVVKGSKIHLN